MTIEQQFVGREMGREMAGVFGRDKMHSSAVVFNSAQLENLCVVVLDIRRQFVGTNVDELHVRVFETEESGDLKALLGFEAIQGESLEFVVGETVHVDLDSLVLLHPFPARFKLFLSFSEFRTHRLLFFTDLLPCPLVIANHLKSGLNH